ncbi:MAG: hypothetical protein RMJ48_11005, partial [Roseiflexaceae bacterium]|nr:hypothetical protein [Roseiflexaceae bacterium]
YHNLSPAYCAADRLLGGTLSLTAYQYQPLWRDARCHRTAGTAVDERPRAYVCREQRLTLCLWKSHKSAKTRRMQQ